MGRLADLIILLAAANPAAAQPAADTPQSVRSMYPEPPSEIIPSPTDYFQVFQGAPRQLTISARQARTVKSANLQAHLAMDAAGQCFRLRETDSPPEDAASNERLASECTFMASVGAEHRWSAGCDEPPVQLIGGLVSCKRMGDRWAILVGTRNGSVPIALLEDKPIALSTAILHSVGTLYCLVATKTDHVYITKYTLFPRHMP